MTHDKAPFNWYLAIVGTIIYIAVGGLAATALIALFWWLGSKMDLFGEPTLNECLIIYFVLCGIALSLYLLLVLSNRILAWRERRRAKKAGAYELHEFLRDLERQRYDQP